MKVRKIFWFSILTAFALLLSACGAGSKEPTPTPIDPNQIAANAIATFAMGLTQTAFAMPTATFTPEPTATNTLPAVTAAPLLTNTPLVPANPCSSQWVSDLNYPDGTVVQPGEQFVKKWVYKNSGTCTWTNTFKIAFGGIGIMMGGQGMLVGRSVKPGEQFEIAIAFTAPTVAGDYESYWKFQDDKGQFFGDWIWLKIKVAGNAPTATPTETPTATP